MATANLTITSTTTDNNHNTKNNRALLKDGSSKRPSPHRVTFQQPPHSRRSPQYYMQGKAMAGEPEMGEQKSFEIRGKMAGHLGSQKDQVISGGENLRLKANEETTEQPTERSSKLQEHNPEFSESAESHQSMPPVDGGAETVEELDGKSNMDELSPDNDSGFLKSESLPRDKGTSETEAMSSSSHLEDSQDGCSEISKATDSTHSLGASGNAELYGTALGALSGIRNVNHDFEFGDSWGHHDHRSDSGEPNPMPTDYHLQIHDGLDGKVVGTASDGDFGELGGVGEGYETAVEFPAGSGSSDVSMGGGSNMKKVGQYLLGRTLGEGSYAKVRLATHLISKQEVAIKVVPKRVLVHRENARRRFRREALFLQKLAHPGVVRLYEVMETSNCYYLVFQLVKGGNLLNHVLGKTKLTEDEAKVFMRQMASAVDHIHRSGLVHRDLKLENFLLDEDGNPKLIDLGLSSVCNASDSALSTQCGSPVYAAPELFAGRKYGHAVDVWSLGVCLFAMLTGRLPFLPPDGSSLSQLYSLILQGCQIPTDLSPSCQNLLQRMLDLQPNKRIAIEHVLSHDWLKAPNGHPIRRQPPVPKKRLPSDLHWGIVRHMCTMYRFSENEVVTAVVHRRLCASAATYNILKDGLDSGKVTVSFKTESAPGRPKTKDQNSTSTTTSLPMLPRAHSKSARTKSSSSGGTSASKGNRTRPKSQVESRNGVESREGGTPDAAMISYKKCLIGLKRTRQRLTGNHNGAEKGSPRDSPRDATLTEIRSPRVHDHGRSPQLPYIPGLGHLNGARGDVESKGDAPKAVRMNTTRSLDLGVKGTCPWSQQHRNIPSSIGFADSQPHHKRILHSLDANANPAFSAFKTPPPPPPNSSFGPTPMSIHLSNQANNQNFYQQRYVPGHTHLTNHSPQQTRFSPSEPPRPTLTSLRDAFGIDATKDQRKSSIPFSHIHRRGSRISSEAHHPLPSTFRLPSDARQLSPAGLGKRQLTLYHVWSKNDLWDRGKSYVNWMEPEEPKETRLLNITAKGSILRSQQRQQASRKAGREMSEKYNKPNEAGRPNSLVRTPITPATPAVTPANRNYPEDVLIGQPGLSRDDTDSPFSQSQEREDFPMPVMSVTINVRS